MISIEDKYDEKEPNKLNNFRPRNIAGERTDPKIKYSHKNQGERIKDQLTNTG